MHNMMLIIANILKRTFRKKINIIIYLLLPLSGVILSLLIYGGASSRPLRLGITNNDAGVLSADIKADLKRRSNFKVYEIEEGAIKDKILSMDIDAAIVIPEGYSEGIYRGKPASIDVVTIKGQDTTVWVSQMLNGYTDMLVKLSSASGGDRDVFDSMYGQYKEGLAKLTVIELEDKLTGRSMALSSMGILLMFMMLGAGLINILILKEKRDGTYNRICSAPVRDRQYIAANALASLMIVILQILTVQLIMKFVLRIDAGIGDAAMFVILLMFGLAAIGLGLAITAFSSSSYMASTLNTLVMTPTCMLGGCYWPVEFMPDIMQKLSYFMPQRWALDAIKKLQNGGTQADISMSLLILAAFAAALSLLAIYRFSRSKNVQKFV